VGHKVWGWILDIGQNDISLMEPQALEGNIITVEQMQKARQRKRKGPKLTQADMSQAERYVVEYKDGLSTEQVAKRNEDGYINFASDTGGKTYGRILFNNLVTFFNFLTFGVAIALIIAGAGFAQMFFMVIILVNLAIGIWQEFKAKAAVAKLTLVSAPTAMVVRNGSKVSIPISEVVLDDIIYLEQGKQIPSDARVIHGELEVNESMLTGESVPIAKKNGSTILGGSFVTAGKCYARVERVGSANYVQTLSSHAKRYVKPKSEIQDSVRRIIKVVSIILVPISTVLIVYSFLNNGSWQATIFSVSGSIIGMIPAGMFLLTSLALFVGQARLARKNVLVQDLYCIEMLARVNILCLDKTGTITDGTMQVNEVVEVGTPKEGAKVAELVSAIITATGDNNQTALALANKFGYATKDNPHKPKKVLPFSSTRKMSAVEFEGQGTYFLGAPEFVLQDMGSKVEEIVNDRAKQGLRVMCLAHSMGEIKEEKLPGTRRALALIAIEDHIREDAITTIKHFRENGVKVKVISGDNPLTVSEVAKRVGIDKADLWVSLDGFDESQVISVADKYTVFGRVTPEQKQWLVKAMKLDRNNTVAMTGDGVNDILAMKESDCAISVASGSEAARNVSHLVLMDSNFNSMPSVVQEGRRVINNIEKSSALFLMKTLMTILLTALVLINIVLPPEIIGWMREYPLQTNNLLMFELFVVGVPSMFLALQSNKEIIKGKFLYNVLSQSVPGGLALFANIVALYIFRHRLGLESDQQILSMIVISMIFTGLMVLIRIASKPSFNTFRVVLVVVVFGLTSASVFALGPIFGIDYKPAFLASKDDPNVLNMTQTLFLFTTTLLAYGVVGVLTTALSKVKL